MTSAFNRRRHSRAAYLLCFGQSKAASCKKHVGLWRFGVYETEIRARCWACRSWPKSKRSRTRAKFFFRTPIAPRNFPASISRNSRPSKKRSLSTASMPIRAPAAANLRSPNAASGIPPAPSAKPPRKKSSPKSPRLQLRLAIRRNPRPPRSHLQKRTRLRPRRRGALPRPSSSPVKAPAPPQL